MNGPDLSGISSHMPENLISLLRADLAGLVIARGAIAGGPG